ncbi:SOS response associated peptidase [Gracilaria domingensis]|nr:SOS response associated peptidase [Gracilaria domingensis]
MKWGFSRAGSPLINARKETVLELPTFRAQMSRRCAIPTTGFFEWQKDIGPGKTSKTPFLVRGLADAKYEEATITYMAGIYRRERQSGENVDTFVVLTENSAPELAWLHDRQPVFLRDEKQVQTWLSHNVPASDAVSILEDGTGFSWWRMRSDLSDKFRGRLLKQKGLDAFFGVKGKSKKEVDLKVKPPLQKQSKKPLKKKS